MPVSKRAATECTPYWKSECGRVVIYVGDCREVMAQMEPEQFHAVVTDPPYNLIQGGLHLRTMRRNGDGTDRTQQDNYKAGGFMGQRWDGTGVPFQPEMWEKVLHLTKLGAHLLSFGGTRMWHRMACAIEDAGWEIRDTIMWVYSQGFPKSVDVSKAIDKMLGAEREKMRTPMSPEGNVWMDAIGANRPWKEKGKEVGYHEHDGNVPVTDTARQWNGWGTSLKPSYEPVILARKPFSGTVARCVMDNGTGALNVDRCRVGTDGGSRSIAGSEPSYLNNVYGRGMGGNPKDETYIAGRWPANLIHDGSDEVIELFPESKSSSSVMPLPLTPGNSVGEHHGNSNTSTLRGFNDSGSAARFFYVPKADDDDRPHGKGKHVTTHPTVKPLDLMRYLVRLVCVRGGVVLDPFMGSGSTGCAAIAEGMGFVGIEQSQEYADIAVGRLRLALAEAPEMEEVCTSKAVDRVVGGSPLAPRKLH